MTLDELGELWAERDRRYSLWRDRPLTALERIEIRTWRLREIGDRLEGSVDDRATAMRWVLMRYGEVRPV